MHTVLTTSTLRALAAGVVLTAASAASAFTIITNGGFASNNQPLPGFPSYGSNVAASSANFTAGLTGTVTGTPDIALTWATTGNAKYDTYINWDGRGNVVQLEDTGATDEFNITFTPAAGWAVELTSFALDKWSGGGNIVVDWNVSGSLSGLLANGTWNTFNSVNDPGNVGGRSTIFPEATGALGEAITLQFLFLTGDGTYLALDNLTFAQVPEPATTAALAGGAALLLVVALRRRRS